MKILKKNTCIFFVEENSRNFLNPFKSFSYSDNLRGPKPGYLLYLLNQNIFFELNFFIKSDMLVRSNILLKSDHLLKFDIFFNLFFISNLKAAIYKNEFLINFIFFLLLTPSKSVIWLINRSDSFLVHGWFTGLGIVKLKTLTDCLSSSNLKTLIS